jgi:hypothetical protein
VSAHAEPPPAGQPLDACPRCGATLRADQDWCLMCGAAVTTHVAGAPGWRTPVAIVGVVLLLAAGGLLFAFLELSDDADRVARAPTPTPTGAIDTVTPTPTPSATPSPTPAGPSGPSGPTGATRPTGPTGSTSPRPSPSPSPSPTGSPSIPGVPGGEAPDSVPDDGGSSAGGGTIASWPSGEEAYTVVLKSATTRSEADKRARELQGQGKSVGVLNSSDYSSLRSGYWVVFSGQYEDKSAAESAATGFKSSVPEAYVRLVTP